MNDQISPLNEHGQFAWDASSMSLYLACPRKYQYKILEGWEPTEKSVHLLFGGWYASALELFYKLLARNTSRQEALEDTILWTLGATWMPVYASAQDAKDGKPIEGKGAPWSSSIAEKTRETLIRTIIWYIDHFENDPCETYFTLEGKPAVEYSFKIDIGNGLLYCGHLDRVTMFGDDPFVMDQKTTKNQITKKYWEGWDTDYQMTGYTFAGQAIFNIPVKGVIIDAVQIQVGGSKFERGFTNRTQAHLDEWLEETHYYAGLARKNFEHAYFPMNRASCGNYGGCEYRSVCAHSPEQRLNWLRAKFTQKPVEDRWNPLVER